MIATLATEELMLKGDRFLMNFNEWYRIVHSGNNSPLVSTKKTVEIEVKRIYASGDRVNYLCQAIDERSPEFVITQLSGDFYTVSIANSRLPVSGYALALIREKHNIQHVPLLGQKGYFYGKEDAEKFSKAIEETEFFEKNGYLVLKEMI